MTPQRYEDVGEIAAGAGILRMPLDVAPVAALGLGETAEPRQQKAMVVPRVRMLRRPREQLPVLRERLLGLTRVLQRDRASEQRVVADQASGGLHERRRAKDVLAAVRIGNVIRATGALGIRAGEEARHRSAAAAAAAGTARAGQGAIKTKITARNASKDVARIPSA